MTGPGEGSRDVAPDRSADDVVDTPKGDAATAEGAAPSAGGPNDYPDVTVDDDGDLVEAVAVAETIAKERDEYLDMARRVQAEFENYKRRVESQRDEQRERAAEDLVRDLLPVLDAGEAATAAGSQEATPLHKHLVETLEKRGLQLVSEAGVEFDPNIHEAVMHEAGEDDPPVVVEVMRTGYLWNSRVVRPAMVKVRG